MAKDDIRVLVVDDNIVNVKIALIYLSKHNINAVSAGSGAEALEMINDNDNDYDLVFMDHMMPEMDGIEATKRIRALPNGKGEKIPIIALSANAIDEVNELFTNAGMNDFLSKPIDRNALNSILIKWLPDKMAAGK
ncbi:MAG: response regulator [Synergistaceae bacterium]|nr:response regulator [Synergistaceae bacterium]